MHEEIDHDTEANRILARLRASKTATEVNDVAAQERVVYQAISGAGSIRAKHIEAAKRFALRRIEKER